MKDSIDHALLITGLLERDIARICASGTSVQQSLAGECAEHRLAIANCLRHIEQVGILEKVAERSREINAMQSKLTELDEHSFKAGDFNGYAHDGFGDINEPDDDTYMRHAAVSDARALADYQRKISRLGWVLAGIAAVGIGVILGAVKIWFTYF